VKAHVDDSLSLATSAPGASDGSLLVLADDPTATEGATGSAWDGIGLAGGPNALDIPAAEKDGVLAGVDEGKFRIRLS
jgi:hypothetical protein